MKRSLHLLPLVPRRDYSDLTFPQPGPKSRRSVIDVFVGARVRI